MPVPTSPSTDCRIWKFERFGVYTVSSGYNFLIRSSYEQHEVFDQHSVNSKKSFYGSLWVLKVPPKGRGNSRASCVFMFFSQQLMQELGQFIDFPPLDQNWFSWLSHLFAILSKDRCALLITAVWALWYYHNNEVHENRSLSVKEIATFVLSFVNDLGCLQIGKGPRGNPSQELLFVVLMVVYWQL
ncbi:hypothetical protein V6N12_046434 [Hibiscus sabdariffa]|uniref:Uncharacterized protein n=1 Tax=Hibiscus sabdariffa TaxID=183260 RepID=A0ABR2DK90_9ROSI